MSASRAILNQLRILMRPLETKLANMVGRAVITSLNDTTKRQAAQVGVLAGETLDDVEHFIPYGLISVPRAGAEGVALFVDGDRGHPLLVAVDDRSARPAGGDPGDTGLYHFDGAKVKLTASGDIVISAKPGQKVLIDDGSGGAAPVATLADVQAVRDAVNSHEHLYIPTSGTPGPATATTGGPTVPSPSGTEVLEAK